MAGPLHEFLPHRGTLIGHSLAHSAGYSGTQLWAAGLPPGYRRLIVRLGLSVRSPMLERLMASDGTVFFDAERDGAAVDPQWLAAFRAAGMHNLLGLNHRPGDPANPFMTAMAIYNVPPDAETRTESLRQELMPPLHAALRRIQGSMSMSMMSAAAARDVSLTTQDDEILRLLLQGRTNKEIGRLIGKSPETVKSRIGPLIHRFGVRNRTELVSVIASRLPAEGDS
jgi:DNA-binding CsgD family transcriptional regulator